MPTKSSSSKTTSGIFQSLPQRGGFLRDSERSFQPGQGDAYVPPALIQEYGITEGARVTGPVTAGNKGPRLAGVDQICDLPPSEWRNRTPFDQLVAVSPQERFRLGDNGNLTMRIVELVAPIGRGTRGLIVAPPQAGKTRILEEIAQGIRAERPQARILLLLIDERPEEVTHFRRAVDAEVLASSNDQGVEDHVQLAELTMAHVRCELECGRDIVLLVDSITRLARAFNLHGSGAGRTLSGGLDARALEVPRRLFGLARNIENGGSVTVIATALIETGSRMDEHIFEEFKGTGNSQIVLNRSLAEARLYPAIDIPASGTRREELLYSEEEAARLRTLRRWLAGGNAEAALKGLLKLVQSVPTNQELLQRLNPS